MEITTSPAPSVVGDRPGRSSRIALEQTVEVVAAHGPLLAAVLKQEARKRCLQQVALVPGQQHTHMASQSLVGPQLPKQ